MPVSISKLPEVTNVKDNSFMLITQDGTTKRTMCDQFVTEEEARLDEFSPTVITSKSMSKTGEGDNVDYSSSAYDAPMKDVVLKGKTMVNCIQEPSSQDVVLPYEFEDGQYVTINDTKESGTLGVELKGQTLVNIPTAKTYYVSNKLTSEWVATFQESVDSVKTNTKYYIGIFNNSEETKSYGLRFNPFTVTSKITIDPKSYGFLIGTTVSDINSTALIINASDHNLDNNVDILFIEYQEGMENWEIPYFEGMTSCKMPILHTVGKNLLKYSMDNVYTNSSHSHYAPILNEDGSITVNSCYDEAYWLRKGFYVEKGKKYTVTVTGMKSENQYSALCFGFDNLKYLEGGAGKVLIPANTSENCIDTIDTYGTKKMTCTALETGYITRFYIHGSGLSTRYTILEFQVEEGSTATSYEPHKSSILSLPEEVVLRSLPNGVCDTFNIQTGVYTRRIKEIVLNGTEGWYLQQDYGNGAYRYKLTLKDHRHQSINIPVICDKIPVYTSSQLNDTIFGLSSQAESDLQITIPSSFAQQNGIDGTPSSLKTWLSTLAPIAVQYELIEPIVTKINLPSTLKSWNTTTHIYSEIPENTLYPILSHSNPSYPVILKPSTKYSIVTNSYSNNHTNSAINFNLGGATTSTTVGNRVTTITTPSTLTSEELVMSGRGNKLNNVMVIEGDVIGDEPYFEGICDVKSPILLNVGKNLAKLTRSYTSFGLTFKVIDDTLYVDGTAERILDYYLTTNNCENSKMLNSLEVGTMVTLSNSLGLRNYFGVWRNGTTDDSWFSNTMTIQNGDNNIRCFIRFDQGSTYNNQAIKIQLEATQNPTTYEPYKSNTTTFEQKDDKTIVLRSLPNGTCDTLNVETGEYVQRIGEIFFDGTNKQWEVLAYPPHNNNTHYQFKHQLGEGVIGGGLWANAQSILSNTLPSANESLHWRGNGNYGIGGDGNSIMITWKKDVSPFNDIATLNAWLKKNPTIVQYELATPIVTTIDVQGFPYAYKDGHVQLSSGSIEQSLTPKVEYNIATNRGGQITQNTKSLIRQGKLLNDIENKINQIIEATINDGIMLMKLRNK